MHPKQSRAINTALAETQRTLFDIIVGSPVTSNRLFTIVHMLKHAVGDLESLAHEIQRKEKHNG